MRIAFNYVMENAPGHNISCKIARAPSKDSDQNAQSHILIWVFAGQSVGGQGQKASSDEQRRLWSGSACADA